jgi:hypothetical protein
MYFYIYIFCDIYLSTVLFTCVGHSQISVFQVHLINVGFHLCLVCLDGILFRALG